MEALAARAWDWIHPFYALKPSQISAESHPHVDRFECDWKEERSFFIYIRSAQQAETLGNFGRKSSFFRCIWNMLLRSRTRNAHAHEVYLGYDRIAKSTFASLLGVENASFTCIFFVNETRKRMRLCPLDFTSFFLSPPLIIPLIQSTT